MKRIALLCSQGTLPGSPTRRSDAYEHDYQRDALLAGLSGRGVEAVEIDWRAPIAGFAGFDLFLVFTPWDYQDRQAEFLARLDALAATGAAVCNSPALIAWNSDKRYLADLAGKGAPTIPTVWLDTPDAAGVGAAFDALGNDRLVVKRRVGAGAEGQSMFSRAAPPPPGWTMDRPAMVQPFLPAIIEEGELSFVFVGGAFSHALVKRAASGDYRIQSLYGGTEHAIDPAPADLAAARAIIAALPEPDPLYARIDMVRGTDGALLLMEAELIEPYLYPLQGPDFGPRMADAVLERLG
jgi:glutathione synthase/RimK-type ligase-like ATP-grasp enzyme